MVDLLVIQPGDGNAYQGLDKALETPLWARIVAGYCRDRGHSVRVLDDEPLGRKATLLNRARVICVLAYGHQPNASTQTMPQVIALCREICGRLWIGSRRRPKIVVVGGHVSALPYESWLQTGADYVVVGEGPLQIERLLAGDHPNTIPGLFDGERAMAASSGAPPSVAPLLPMAELHGRAWDLLPMQSYRAHNWQCLDGSPRTPYASIHTSLGCPYKCSFCCINAPFGGPGYRTRSPEEVVAEVRHLHDAYGVTTLKISDEMFVLKPSHYGPICEGLAQLPFASDLNIWAYARIDTVKEDRLALLRKAGIRWLALGIESGSAHVRDGAAKAIDGDDIKAAVEAIRRAGIHVIGNFIFGLPDDTRETMQATLDLALDLRCEFANFYSAMAYPGSRLYGEVPAEHLPASWSGYAQHGANCRPLPTDTLTSAEVLAFRDAAHVRYFTDERYLEHVMRTFGPGAVAELAGVAQPLHRDLLAA